MSLERIDVVCTGGTYDDPEHGRSPRHPRQKLGRLRLHRPHQLEQTWKEQKNHWLRPCPQCGRHNLVAYAKPILDGGVWQLDGGVWQRIVEWAEREHPDRRVIVVDISDPVYPW